MSSIGGCGGPSQHEILFQQGLQQAQAAHVQQQQALEQQTITGNASSPGLPPIEANKGLNIDVYA